MLDQGEVLHDELVLAPGDPDGAVGVDLAGHRQLAVGKVLGRNGIHTLKQVRARGKLSDGFHGYCFLIQSDSMMLS